MDDFEQTIISQFANSRTIKQLVANMNAYIDPQTDFDTFFDFVWNVDTAQAWGLDIWGKIVGIGRTLTIPGEIDTFGFSEGVDWEPFGQAPLYSVAPATQAYVLSDAAYRTLILVKALGNISNCTAASYNQLLQNLFAGRGRCYVADTGQMTMRYVFEFALEPFELAIMTQSGAIPRPAAVSAFVLEVDIENTFGFSESMDAQPFGQGILFNSGLINAS